jgi:hypothetical protein
VASTSEASPDDFSIGLLMLAGVCLDE